VARYITGDDFDNRSYGNQNAFTMTTSTQTDVLVIGSGLGGLAAAWDAAKRGCEVILLTRARDPEDSNTYRAQGGIIYRGHDEKPEQLEEDILSAGAGSSATKARAW
jgi:L-aspartate oxidase